MMTDELKGKHVFVAGAGQGIGRAIALACAEAGASVTAASRTLSKMDDLPNQAPAIRPIELDVTDVDGIAAAVKQADAIDVLINCAGWVADGTVLESDAADWSRSWQQNVMSCVWLVQAILPGMLERRCGSIVNVASVASSVTGVSRRAAYGTTKAALIGLTKAIARDHIGDGVRCNALCPGTTASPSLEARIEATVDPDATRRAFIARQPMGRLGSPDEMAAAAVWMASDQAAFMTGQVVIIDGGQTL